MDLRERIVEAVLDGLAQTVAARRFVVSLATVQRYMRLVRQDQLAPRPIPGRPRLIPPDQEGALRAQLEAAPDATLAEHVETWAEQQRVRISDTTMADAILRLGWTRKKRFSMPASRTR
jgi:transposase